LRDLCRPGDVVFDVGANAGSLSVLMSRLVGPRGVVCSFEASPRIVDKCQYNLMVNGCTNVTLYHRAVYRESRQMLQLFAGPHLNDSLVQWTDSPTSNLVQTVSIDDFVSYTGLVPKLIKMDVEGAEFDALQGMTRTLATNRPQLILEQSPRDMRCHEVLVAAGYRAIDLATLRTIESQADFDPLVDVANVLFVHEQHCGRTPYSTDITRRELPGISGEQFRRTNYTKPRFEAALSLLAGRYAIELDVASDSHDCEVMCGVDADGQNLMRYHANANFLSRSYRQWVIDLPRGQSVKLYWRVLNDQPDTTLQLRGAKIERLTSFDNWLAPLVD
jgi:FkbM family methyltransferase